MDEARKKIIRERALELNSLSQKKIAEATKMSQLTLNRMLNNTQIIGDGQWFKLEEFTNKYFS
jgi:plasmid maintenance system antidote protein VapI